MQRKIVITGAPGTGKTSVIKKLEAANYYCGRIKQYIDSLKKNNDIIFFDRGIPDVLAYMDFFKQEYTPQFTRACTTNTYNHIFLLPPWEEIYVSDNERFESFEEAKQIHYHLENTYHTYGYTIELVPFGTVQERVDFILNSIKNE